MVPNTRNSATNGSHKLTAAKSSALVATRSSRPKANRAAAVSSAAKRSSKRSSVGSTSDTLTETSRNTADQSTPVATEPQPLTKPDDGASISQSDQPSPTGGPPNLTVTAAVERDLAEIAKSDPNLAISGLAALAIALAHKMDGDMADTAVPMCAGQLRDTLNRLRELCPPEQKPDELDDLAARRAARLAGDSTTTN